MVASYSDTDFSHMFLLRDKLNKGRKRRNTGSTTPTHANFTAGDCKSAGMWTKITRLDIRLLRIGRRGSRTD